MKLTREYFGWFHPHLKLNLNGTCFRCSDVAMRIAGYIKSIYHDKSMEGVTFSTEVISIRTMDVVNDPVVLLESGNIMHKRFIGKNISNNFEETEGYNTRMINLTWMV